jgi:hypothetical protein
LLVEGGDERAVCQAIAGPAGWSRIVCWNAQGRDQLVKLAAVATLDPNFQQARAVGVVLDMEDDGVVAHDIAQRTLVALGASSAPAHGVFQGSSPQLGVFLSPNGVANGCIETLCREAVTDPKLAACVDALVVCAGGPHSVQAHADKGWLRAYLGMCADPNLRFHQALVAASGINPAHAAFDPLRAFLQAL